LLARPAAAHSVFFPSRLSPTAPLPAYSQLRSHSIDLTHTDRHAQAAFQLTLDSTRRNLRGVDAHLADPLLHWLSQFVGMPMAIIQENRGSFVFVTRQFDQAVGGGARNVRLALGHRRLPRLAGEHAPDELQARSAIRAVFHLNASFHFVEVSSTSGPHCTT